MFLYFRYIEKIYIYKNSGTLRFRFTQKNSAKKKSKKNFYKKTIPKWIFLINYCLPHHLVIWKSMKISYSWIAVTMKQAKFSSFSSLHVHLLSSYGNWRKWSMQGKTRSILAENFFDLKIQKTEIQFLYCAKIYMLHSFSFHCLVISSFPNW